MPPIHRAGPNELTNAQMRAGVDFDEDELMPGEEEDRSRKPSDPDEQKVTRERMEGR